MIATSDAASASSITNSITTEYHQPIRLPNPAQPSAIHNCVTFGLCMNGYSEQNGTISPANQTAIMQPEEFSIHPILRSCEALGQTALTIAAVCASVPSPHAFDEFLPGNGA